MSKSIGIFALVVAIASIATAQKPGAAPKSAAKPAGKAAAKPAESAPSQLPVTSVSLYKNGVGFFEHSGRVTGNQSVNIDFTTAQLNDVLQSLTAIDLNGGRIAGAGYNSTTPLDQQLSALSLNLPDETTFSKLFTALRGARVEVTGSGAPFTGRIVDIEMHKTGAGKDETGMTEGRFLTLAGDGGNVRIFEITPAVTVRLLDTATGESLTQYLKVLDSNRNQGLRHLTLADNGTGTRELHVSYISEVPIWKSTYRILFTEPKTASTTKQTATLQGWSVVDNTTGADWINVHLSLIAGAPQSFIQPLSVPYYSRRPEIGLPQEAQLTPQTHESGELKAEGNATKAITGSAMGSGMGSGVAGGNFGGAVTMRAAPLPAAPPPNGIYGGAGQTNLNENYIEGMPYSNLPLQANSTTLSYQAQVASSFAANAATTAAFDDYFAYNISEPITIRKNESAMVPILQTKVDAERVTLWSQRQPTPLRALWITNTSDLTLDRGSFSIIEDGNFGGEGLLDPIHPNEKRLLSYAVDQAVRVSTENQHDTTHANRLTSAKGVMELHETQLAEVTYVVHNAATDARTVVIEHPIRPNYILENGRTKSNTDPKPDESTPTVYRFRVAAKPGETARLHVAEYHSNVIRYQLTSFNDNQLTFILNQTNNDPSIKQALEPILEARRHVADMQSALDKVNSRLNDLHADEERQRANITALASADKASRDRFVHDLNATEDQIAAAQKDLVTAQANLQAAKDALADKIETLQIDDKL